MSETMLLGCKILTFVMFADSVYCMIHGRLGPAIVSWVLGTGILYHIRPYFFRERARG